MTTYISMLRGINVGVSKKVAMEALRQVYTGLGFDNVQSYVQSGNVVFDSAEPEAAVLAGQIEAHIEQTFGFSVLVFVRSAPYIQRIIAANPFVRGGADPGNIIQGDPGNIIQGDPGKLHVTFFYTPPDPQVLGSLSLPAAAGDDRFAPGEGAVYLFCPNGYGKTRLSNDFFERRLKVSATTRNWNTVNALYQLANR
jgi:uncharacterized protein (DUF1697 family)